MGCEFEFSRKDSIVAVVSVVIVVSLALTPVFIGNTEENVIDIQNDLTPTRMEDEFQDTTQNTVEDITDEKIEITSTTIENIMDGSTNIAIKDDISTKMSVISNRIEIKNKENYNQDKAKIEARVRRVLSTTPLIDGHNDLAMGVRELLENKVDLLNLDHDLLHEEPWASYTYNHTDLPRLRKGLVGGVFWSAYMGCSSQYKDAIQVFLEQMDVIKQIIAKYPEDLAWADSADSIEEGFKSGRIASLVGVEGGHAIGSSLAVLRTLYDGGARYLTLTHSCNTPWADASPVDSGDLIENSNGLSQFGKLVILEMNRLGLMIDLSHVSHATMLDSISTSLAPIIFSHSSAFSVCHHPRNVRDDVLSLLPDVGGLVMVNFNPCFLRDDCDTVDATVKDIVKHINHVRDVAGVDHVGLGSDFGGINEVPMGVEDVSKFPEIFKALINDATFKWSNEDLAKLAGGNLIRTLRDVEKVRDSLKQEKPINNWIKKEDLDDHNDCNST